MRMAAVQHEGLPRNGGQLVVVPDHPPSAKAEAGTGGKALRAGIQA